MSDEKLPPSRTAPQFIVRFPEGMREQIAEAARANNRSINAEIVDRLMSVFELKTENETLKQRVASSEALLSEVVQRQRALEIDRAKLLHRLSEAEAEARTSKSSLQHAWKRNDELKADIERAATERQKERESFLQIRAKDDADHRREIDRLNAQMQFLREQVERAPSNMSEMRHALEMQTFSAQTQAEMMAMRAELLRLRAENLHTRHEAAAREVEDLTRNAKTDHDFARVEAKIVEMRRLEAALAPLGKEIDALIVERKAALSRLDVTHAALRDAQKVLEEKMREYLARQTPEKRRELERASGLKGDDADQVDKKTREHSSEEVGIPIVEGHPGRIAPYQAPADAMAAQVLGLEKAGSPKSTAKKKGSR